MKDFLEHDFWRYSVKLYSKKAVETACLLLQNTHNLNMNILLYCLYHPANGRGIITTRELERVAFLVDNFNKKITSTLRKTRQLWKKLSNSSAIYHELFHLELAAEQIEQAIIMEALFSVAQNNRTDREKLNDCMASLNNYFCQKSVILNKETRNAIMTLLQYAFPKYSVNELTHVA
jgi:uncharacterized protein (TIGR02444 family)